MAFTIRNMFSPGSGVETPEAASEQPKGFVGAAGSPFGMADMAPPDSGRPGGSGFGSFAAPGAPSPFKPIADESFRMGNPPPMMGGGGPVTSPFSMGSAPALMVADILPNLPPEVARANGAPPDQPVTLSSEIVETALANGSGAVPLFEVFRVCPGLFQVPISPADPRLVRLPQNKLSMLASARGAVPAAMPPGPAPSPFSMSPTPDGMGMPSPFSMSQAQPAPGVLERDKPVSRPVGTLPPRRPDGVPPAIPTQNDFAAPPALQLPTFGSPDAGGGSPPPSGSPFQFSVGVGPGPNPSPAPGGMSVPPSAPPPGNSPFLMSPGFGAAGSTNASEPAPAPSPFASIFTQSAAASRSGPLITSTPGAPPSFGGAFPSPSAPLPTPPAAPPQMAPGAGSFFGGIMTPPSVDDNGSRGPSPFISAQPPTPSPSRPLNAPMAGFVMPGTVASPQLGTPPSRPLASMPSNSAPTTSSDTVELSLASIVKGYSPAELGFDPNFIPAWIMTKLPAYLVKQQAGASEVKVDMGAVIDGTDDSFRPVIAHGKRDFRVKLPMNDVFHALPQVGGKPAPSLAETFAARPPEPPAPPPVAASSRPLQPVENKAPIQPVGLQGAQSPFHFGSSSRPLNPPMPKPPEQPSQTPVQGGWQAAGAPSPLFEVGNSGGKVQQPFQPQIQMPPMPEIASAPPQPALFQPATATRPLQPNAGAAAIPGFGSPSQPMVAAPAPSLPPMSMNVTAGVGSKDQMVMRALLGASGPFDRNAVVKLISQHQGVECCVFISGEQLLGHGNGGSAASDFQRQASDMARGLRALAGAIGIGEAETLSVNSDTRLVTFSFQGNAALGVLHSDREPPSGLREKISLLCKELAAMPQG